MQYISIIIMLVLGCNTLHALDNSLYIRLADEEGEHAMIEVDRMDAGASGDGCVWDFSGAEALCTHKVQTAAEDSVLAVKFMRDIYCFRFDGDVVRWYSFENRLTKIEDSVGVINMADYVIDMGPDGGAGGGRIIAAGTPEQIAAGTSPTAPFLR